MADVFGAEANALLGLTGSGSLAKLTIYGYEYIERDEKKTPDTSGPPSTFNAFINPDEITVTYSTAYDHTTAIGNDNAAGTFLSSTPMELQLKFFLDGTLPRSKDDQFVVKNIKDFYDACGYTPDRHRPKYVRILWGSFTLMRFTPPDVFDGCLKTVSIQYKLFSPGGMPLRALISATFVESISAKKDEANKKNSSPDLTHVRIVKEGDTLPSLTLGIYGDLKYYLEVARVNNLKDFRDLPTGTKLFFPPFDKNAKTNNNA